MFTLFILSILLFTLAYSLLIRNLIYAWDNYNSSSQLNTLFHPVTIIIPARNEANIITHTLEKVFAQNYPNNLIEVILVDDHSTDNTFELVQSQFPNVSLLKNSNDQIGKKNSISYGINNATHEIIITLDADCIPTSDNWISSLISNLINTEYFALTAPVIIESDKSNWQNYQSLENAGMMLTTAAGYQTQWFQLANGANLIFYKNIFQELNGFAGNEYLASGDDMFLFEKIELKYPGKTGFIKSLEASVKTKACKTLKEYINQRIRWGTKNKSLKNINLKLILGFVFVYNILLILSLLFLPFATFPLVTAILLSWLVKINIDYFMLNKATSFFKQTHVMKSYWAGILIYPVMITLTGTLSIFKRTFIWKERKME